MSIGEKFKAASLAESVGGGTFIVVTAATAVLAAFPNATVQAWLHPVLIVGALVAVGTTAMTTICQTQGNRLLRAAQLSNALGASIGENIRADYFNSELSPSFLRLAATTLENTLFTTAVLSRMLIRERFKIAVYTAVLLLLLSVRRTSTEWLLLLAQALFSADLLLAWIRMERFRARTHLVHETLRQFFLQRASTQQPNGMAIVVGAFTDYECAKDEAALPLDSKLFAALNSDLSARWELLKKQVGIVGIEQTERQRGRNH